MGYEGIAKHIEAAELTRKGMWPFDEYNGQRYPREFLDVSNFEEFVDALKCFPNEEDRDFKVDCYRYTKSEICEKAGIAQAEAEVCKSFAARLLVEFSHDGWSEPRKLVWTELPWLWVTPEGDETSTPKWKVMISGRFALEPLGRSGRQSKKQSIMDITRMFG